MTDRVRFYHNPLSRGRMVHWLLEEIGEPYDIKQLSFEKREQKAPEYLAINPMGKVPAIVHRGVVVTETPAICAYLADAFPDAGLAPALDEPARGPYYRWLFFGAGCVDPAIVDKMFDRGPVGRRETLGYGSYEDTIGALEHAIQPGPFILGERFSAADVFIGGQIAFGLATKAVEPRPSFEAYVARLAERPAYRRVNG